MFGFPKNKSKFIRKEQKVYKQYKKGFNKGFCAFKRRTVKDLVELLNVDKDRTLFRFIFQKSFSRSTYDEFMGYRFIPEHLLNVGVRDYYNTIECETDIRTIEIFIRDQREKPKPKVDK